MMLTNVQHKIKKFLSNRDTKRLTKNTQKMYKYALLQLDRFCQRRQIKYLDAKFDMHDFVEWMYKNNLQGKSVQHYVTIVKMLFKFHNIPMYYTYKMSMAEIKALKTKRLRRWLTEDEVDQCLHYKFKTNPVQGELIMRLMIETAARVHEISNIIAENIDLDERIIWIVRTKTDPRTVIFSPYTRELLESYKLQHPKWTGKIFPTTKNIRNMIQDMLRDLGLKEKDDGRGPHTFRHYAATYLYYEGGMDLTELATLMGATTQTLETTYLHPTPKMMRKRVDKAWGWTE